jgi:hypothetical protein
LNSIRDAILYRYNDDAFERVVYSESHDDVANGQARVPHEVNPGDPTGWYAQKRSTMAAVMVFTAPGIPMLFQGQEFLEGEWFRDTVPVDWHQQDQFRGIIRMYRDLIKLRLNQSGCSRGLCGQFTQVYHLNEERKVLAFHRWDQGGPADDVSLLPILPMKSKVNTSLASLPVDSGSCDSTAIGMAIASCLMVLPVTISKLWRSAVTHFHFKHRYPSLLIVS